MIPLTDRLKDADLPANDRALALHLLGLWEDYSTATPAAQPFVGAEIKYFVRRLATVAEGYWGTPEHDLLLETVTFQPEGPVDLLTYRIAHPSKELPESGSTVSILPFPRA